MTQFFKVAFMAAGLVAFAHSGAYANEITGFGPSFTNKAPAALGVAESDPIVAQEDSFDGFNPEDLNEIMPAAGGDVIDTVVPRDENETTPAVSTDGTVGSEVESPEAE